MIRRFFYMVALMMLALIVASCSTNAVHKAVTGATPSAATPTPTPSFPSGTVLYQSDWSQGLAAWGHPLGWKIVNGLAQSDLRDNNALTVPYLSAVPNYAIEVQFQIVSIPTNGGYFVVTAKQLPGKDGYNAGILNLLDSAPHNQFDNPQVQVYLEPEDDMSASLVTSDYRTNNRWNTFRIEVQGSDVRLLINGVGKSSATSIQDDVLSNGPFQVVSSGAVVNVSSVKIMAL